MSLPVATERDPASVSAEAPELCVHCGLPLPGDRRRFCCDGCEAVHRILTDGGFDRYYELRRSPTAPPLERDEGGLAWVDRITPRVSGDVRVADLDVRGIHCAACVWLLDELFRRMPAAVNIRINAVRGTVRLTWRDGFDLKRYVRDASAVGYRLAPPGAGATASGGMGMRLGVSIAMAMNVMVLSTAYYFGLSARDGMIYSVIGALEALLATVAVLVGGSVFVRAAMAALRRGMVSLDVPIALGIVLAYAGSMWAWIGRGPDAAYFDSVTAFIALMLVGRWLQARILERNRRMVHTGGGLEALDCRRRRDGAIATIPARDIEPGDELWIAPGDILPVRGTLLTDALVTRDWITGEAHPISFAAGDEVHAGARNSGNRTLRVEAGEPFESSDVQKLMAEPPAGTADTRMMGEGRLGFWYVCGVLAVATLGFILWLPRGLERSLLVVVSILVVTCPCALGLATPLARELALIALRRRGTFAHAPDLLRRVRDVAHVIFDKTGTLTSGALALESAGVEGLRAMSARHREVLATMVARSRHPVAAAIHRELGEDGGISIGGDEVIEEPGEGLRWTLDGVAYRVGRRSFAVDASTDEDPVAAVATTWFTADGAPLVAFPVVERVYHDAADEIARLRARGLEVRVASGDRRERVERVSDAVGVRNPSAEVSAVDKARLVDAVGASRVMFVGDGLNDLPALHTAHVSGTPAIQRPGLAAGAHFSYLGEGICAVRRVFDAADQVARAERLNLVFAVGYNLVATTLCLLGYVTPVVAAILMPTSSALLVSITIARAKRLEASWRS